MTSSERPYKNCNGLSLNLSLPQGCHSAVVVSHASLFWLGLSLEEKKVRRAGILKLKDHLAFRWINRKRENK